MRLIALNKPFGVLCQFRDPDGRPVLGDYVPVDEVYPAGRLDKDSEGLLLLTDCGAVQHRITHPKNKLPKTYWAQVERVPDAGALERLRRGVRIRDGMTRPAGARLIGAPAVPERDPPIRYRKNVETAWLEITLREGRNRQVRRMTAAVGHPTLRLIRRAVGGVTLENLEPGEWRDVDIAEVGIRPLPGPSGTGSRRGRSTENPGGNRKRRSG